jgi:hypothetical protein
VYATYHCSLLSSPSLHHCTSDRRHAHETFISHPSARAATTLSAAIVLHAVGRDVQLPKHTMAANAEDMSATRTASTLSHCGPANLPIPSGEEAIQPSAVPPRRLTVTDVPEVASPRSRPSPASLPTTLADGDAPVEFPLPVHVAPAPPPSWPATAQQVWPARGTVLCSLPRCPEREAPPGGWVAGRGTVRVIAGPLTTADAQNPIWWQVRRNGVTGWVSGRFLTFTDQEP